MKNMAGCGHTVGAKNVETVCQAADELGIEYLTLYAFSTENWNRPDSEVAALMVVTERRWKHQYSKGSSALYGW
mgnify:CR=1 FL=1